MSEKKLMKGNEAFAKAAINAGCRFYFGYPITPQNEIPEYISREFPKCGGSYIQAESELAAANMAYGAAAAGGRVLISSSSPGIALMQENFSILSSVQVPVVFINVTRGGPGIGSIQPGQADYNQATRGGGNGDYKTIVYAPSSIQEGMDMIYKAFDVADEYRNPVMICADGILGQMMEPVVIPKEIEPPNEDSISSLKPWALTGHKNKRDRIGMNSLWLQTEGLEEYINGYWTKFEKAEEELQEYECINTDKCEVLFVSYGTTARITKEAIDHLGKEGINCGLIRLKTLWPFPTKAFEQIGNNVRKVISVELSKGQMVRDIEWALKCKYKVDLINRVGGNLISPTEIVDRTKILLEGK